MSSRSRLATCRVCGKFVITTGRFIGTDGLALCRADCDALRAPAPDLGGPVHA